MPTTSATTAPFNPTRNLRAPAPTPAGIAARNAILASVSDDHDGEEWLLSLRAEPLPLPDDSIDPAVAIPEWDREDAPPVRAIPAALLDTEADVLEMQEARAGLMGRREVELTDAEITHEIDDLDHSGWLVEGVAIRSGVTACARAHRVSDRPALAQLGAWRELTAALDEPEHATLVLEDRHDHRVAWELTRAMIGADGLGEWRLIVTRIVDHGVRGEVSVRRVLSQRCDVLPTLASWGVDVSEIVEALDDARLYVGATPDDAYEAACIDALYRR